MSQPWDAEVFRVPDISWQTEVPPARHPIPVRYVPELEAGDEVTIGLPGDCFIDAQLVALSGRRTSPASEAAEPEEVEELAVASPFAYWLAKGFPQAGLTMQWWPTARCWTYRDAATAPDAGAQPAGDDGTGSWLDLVHPALHEPPVRHAEPARTARSLSGRTLRLQHERGSWSWWVAVSEPVEVDGDFVVRVMRPSEYWLAQAACEPREMAETVSLHRLYTYH